MKNQETAPKIVKFINRFDNELKNALEADLAAMRRIKHNIIGKINPELNITTLFIA